MTAGSGERTRTEPHTILTGLEIADEPSAWEAAGFAITHRSERPPIVQIGSVDLHLIGSGSDSRGDDNRGIVRWMFASGPADRDDVDGLAVGSNAIPSPAPEAHPNGVDAIDHVVLMTPDGDRTAQALLEAGFEARRTREYTMGDRPMRQTFYWMGDVILEVVCRVGETGPEPSRLWGLALVTPDLDATVAFLGEHASAARHAVQPGRRIASLRHRDLDITVPTAFMTPHPSIASPDQ